MPSTLVVTLGYAFVVVVGDVVEWSEMLLFWFEMLLRRLEIPMEMLLWLLAMLFCCGGWRGCCPGVVGLEMLLLSWLEMFVFDTCGGTVVEKNEKD